MFQRRARDAGSVRKPRIANSLETSRYRGLKRRQTVAVQGAQRVERQHVRRSFPNRKHLTVAQKNRKAGVFYVTSTAKSFENFTSHHHRLFSSREFHHRSKNS